MIALLALLMPVAAMASPGDEIAARFVDVLRRDDLAELSAFADEKGDARAWRDLREILDRFDCVSVVRHEWTAAPAAPDRVALRIDLAGSAALKAEWRPRQDLPRTWHVEARRAGGEWRLTKALTEERRVAQAMFDAQSIDDVERVFRDAAGVDHARVLLLYAQSMEFARIPEKTRRFEHAVSLAQRAADVATEIAVMRRYGHAATLSNAARGLALGDRYVALARAAGSKDDLAGALLTVAIARHYSGDTDGAVETYSACADMAEELDDPTIAIKCQQMALWVSKPTDLIDGFRMIDRIDALSHRYDWEEGQELVLFGRQELHGWLNNLDLVRATSLELIRLGRKHGNRKTVDYATFNLAATELRQKRYEQAVAILGRLPANFDQRIPALDALAAAYTAMGKLDEAEAVLQTAAEAPAEPLHPQIGALWARLHLARGDCERAIAVARDALPRLDLEREDGQRIFGDVLVTLARALRRSGHVAEAAVEMRRRVEMIELRREQMAADALTTALFLTDDHESYVELVELLVEQGALEEALEVAERMKARGLRDAIGAARIDRFGSISAQERKREEALDRRVEELNRARLQAWQRSESADAIERDLVGARRELDALRIELRTLHPAAARRRACEQPVLEVPEGTGAMVVLEYVVAESQIVVFILSRDARGEPAIRAERLPLARKDLEREVRLASSYVAARSPAYADVARRLYAALVEPLEGHLPDATTLAIIPDGVLWTVPFHALVLPDGAYLVDRRPVFYAHSLALLSSASASPVAPPAGLLAFGNPTVSDGARAAFRSAERDVRLGQLADAEHEVRSLAAMYAPRPSAVYYREEAREHVFKEEARRFGIIHVAAHAVVDDRAPLYSAIVLAPGGAGDDDGLLEAREVVDLPLDAELAVLSACETARGRVGGGEGVIGLPWAFFAAGCPTTIVSQWNAESAATAKLMIELHRRLLAGETIAAALRNAQLSVRRLPQYRHPFYWAPFIALGAAGRQISSLDVP